MIWACRIQSEGSFIAYATRFLIEARKPGRVHADAVRDVSRTLGS